LKSLSDMLSNRMFQDTLESLSWQHAENNHQAFEFIKIKQIELTSLFLALILRSLTNSFTFGDYKYFRKGADILERTSPKIVKRSKQNLLYQAVRVLRH